MKQTKKYRIGYTQGVYDMFHIGHLNLINNAKKQCRYLIVGVNADSLVQSYKHKVPVINEEDRREIVSNIKAVDECVIATTLNKVAMHEKLGYDVIFIGDDWKDDARWLKTEEDLARIGVKVVYLPYTQTISSTRLRSVKDNQIEE